MSRKQVALYLAWLLSLFAVGVSFYFSEVVKLEPCHLCWFQRICLFPLALILGIACYRSFFGIAEYVLPLVCIGFLLACYHVLIQEVPGWNALDLCGAGPSCSEKYNIGLGPITIPMLAATGFLTIGLLLLVSKRDA